jgi:peptidoglycan/LPS O-acetylase OafA/YrhL
MTDNDQAMPVLELMSHGRRPSLRALTSLRFFAALYVVLFHCGIPRLIVLPSIFARFLNSGYTGVTLFFSLSGFILAYNYPSVPKVVEFWVFRFARVYPVYVVSLFVYVVITLANPTQRHQPGTIPAMLLSISLIQSWIPAYAAVINPVAWTLSVETFFYAIFPFANSHCRKPSRLLVCLFITAYLALALSPILLESYNSALGIRLAKLMDGTFPFFRLGTFVVGILAGARFLRGRRYPGLLPASLLFTSILLVWGPTDLARPLKTMLLSYAYTGVIYGFATIERGFFTTRLLLIGGEISYSIYLIQFIVLRLSRRLITRILPGSNLDSLTFVLAIFIPILLVISYLSFRFIEVPARRYIRNLSRRFFPSPQNSRP